MSWYGIDAVDRALSRTRKALFEPFDFWKWMKLATIIFFVGASSGYGGSGSNYQTGIEDLENNFTHIYPGQIPDLPASVGGIDLSYIQSLSSSAIIISLVVLLLLLILAFIFISSVMEFVFVEALVKNKVHLRAYSRKFLGKGLRLLIIRLVLGLLSLIIFAMAMLPFIPVILGESSEPSLLGAIGGVFWFIGAVTVLVLLGLVINSFLSLAIPISIYKETEILSAFSMICGNFRKSWQEVVVYWLARLGLAIGISILGVILIAVLVLGSGLIFLAIDGVLYLLFSFFVSEPLLWILLLPFVLIELVLILGASLLISVPFNVFLKYHLLSFLEAWFEDADLPFFDTPVERPETGFYEPEPNF